MPHVFPYRAGHRLFLFACHLIELNGDAVRRDPLAMWRGTLAHMLARACGQWMILWQPSPKLPKISRRSREVDSTYTHILLAAVEQTCTCRRQAQIPERVVLSRANV